MTRVLQISSKIILSSNDRILDFCIILSKSNEFLTKGGLLLGQKQLYEEISRIHLFIKIIEFIRICDSETALIKDRYKCFLLNSFRPLQYRWQPLMIRDPIFHLNPSLSSTPSKPPWSDRQQHQQRWQDHRQHQRRACATTISTTTHPKKEEENFLLPSQIFLSQLVLFHQLSSLRRNCTHG